MSFNVKYPEFATDPRNVRLGLASDGFKPFGAMSINYSIWPIILIPQLSAMDVYELDIFHIIYDHTRETCWEMTLMST